MDEQRAIELALSALRAQNYNLASRVPVALRKERHMRRGKNLSGWLVVVALDVPESFEPNAVHVEVYDHNGEVDIPMML